MFKSISTFSSCWPIGPSNGYGIMKEVDRESNGEVRLEIGSMYRILSRLTTEGVLEDADGDKRRPYYRLSHLDRRVLKAEAERLAGLVSSARVRRPLAEENA
jgi:PadR family transcriptional regulator PadR